MNTDPALVASHLSKRFGPRRALDDVSFEIRRDSIVGLLGRNGAGKTTAMNLLTAQDFPTEGTVLVNGADPAENDAVLSQMCYIRESQQYPNNFRVVHALSAGRNFYPTWDDALADMLLEQFSLPRRCQVAKLSRGMRSSLGILIGLACRAPITIFDEPYLGLDATARQQFYDVLLKDYAEHPRTVLLSTHLIDEISTLLEDVLVLHEGRLVLAGPADELRGSACVLTGPVAAVEQVAAGRPVLHREEMGGHEALTLDVPPDAALRAIAEGLGLDIAPVSLQTLVVRAGARPTTDTRTGAPR